MSVAVANPLVAYVLAGGQSRRFGSDKARAELEGEPLLVRVARRVSPLVASVTVVADRPGKYADLGLSTIADRIPARGPLGGLLTAVEHAPPGSWLLVLTCDQLAFEASWVAGLRAAASAPRRAVAFRDRDWQPFPGLYHTDLHDELDQRVGEQRLSVRSLLDGVEAVAVPLPGDWPEHGQANRPDELAAAAAAFRQRA